MTEINHKERKHARLSASASSRWLKCSGSVKAERDYSDKTSSAAEEGTLAHELGEICLRSNVPARDFVDKRVTGKLISQEMADYVQEYIDYVLMYENSQTTKFIEERVDFSHVAPEGFGTLDAALINPVNKRVHIFDLKYGRGVRVDAENNTQGLLYLLGFCEQYKFMIDEPEKFSYTVNIVQPRLNNITSWILDYDELMERSEWIKERAKLTLSDTAERTAGESQCRWCKAKGDCPELYRFTQEVLASDFDNLDANPLSESKLTNKQKRILLDNASLIDSFVSSVRESVYNKISNGDKFEGYKLVEGRSNRKWNDDAEAVLLKHLGEYAYNKKLIGVTEASKKLTKDDIAGIIYKPKGKVTLVPETDKRKPIKFVGTENDFDTIS